MPAKRKIAEYQKSIEHYEEQFEFLRYLKIFRGFDFPFVKVGDELVVIGQKK